MPSRTLSFGLLVVAILAVAASQVLIKSRLHAPVDDAGVEQGFLRLVVALLGDWQAWLAGFIMVGAAACWYLAMVRLPVSLMIALSGTISPLVAIGAHFALGETLGPAKLAAIALISVGVIWLGLQQA